MKEYTERYGIATCSIGYRFTSGTRVDAEDMMVDIGHALKAVNLIAGQKDFCITSMAMKGISAGAHLALLYAYEHGEETSL